MTKKPILTLSLAALMTIAAVTPTRADATLLFPALPDSVAMAFFGVALVSGTIGYIAEQADISEGDAAQKLNDRIGKWIPKMDTLAGTIFVDTIVGVLILDDSNHAKAVLSPITEEIAKKAQITSEGRQAYNSELEITQQLVDQVSTEISQRPKAEQAPMARDLWEQYRSVMSPESFSAFQKLVRFQNQ